MRQGNTTSEKLSYRAKHAPVSRQEFEALLDRIDDLSDAIMALRAEERGKPSADALPSAFVRRIIGGEHPLFVWREYRGMTQSELAKRAKLKSHSYIVAIEKGHKPGSVGTMKKLASVLGCTIEDLIG